MRGKDVDEDKDKESDQKSIEKGAGRCHQNNFLLYFLVNF
jgi:hypothetical protein